ncbi:MAG: DUF2334 domain-containing protein [archaeon]
MRSDQHLPSRRLLISIHDVTPKYAAETEQLIRLLQDRGINRFSLLVTPDWLGKWPLKKSPAFLKLLQSCEKKGAELVLHGLDHQEPRSVLASPSEKRRRLKNALDLFVDAFGHPPVGYVPPVWMMDTVMGRLLRESGMQYTENHWGFYCFDGRTYRGFPIGMESASNEALFPYDRLSPLFSRWFSKFYARLKWNRPGVVRYALHPREIHNGNLEATSSLLDGFLKRGWEPVCYNCFI